MVFSQSESSVSSIYTYHSGAARRFDQSVASASAAFEERTPPYEKTMQLTGQRLDLQVTFSERERKEQNLLPKLTSEKFVIPEVNSENTVCDTLF